MERTNLPLQDRREGKVRDVYGLPPANSGESPRILLVATDRLSAFDVVLPTPIPGKGRLLTDISTRWFQFIEQRGLAYTFLLSTEVSDIPGLAEADRAALQGRVVIGTRCEVVPVECVARGYLAGSGWVEYQQSGRVCGVELPPGLRQGDRLPQPIFTPATKAEQGAHDENISFEQACEIAGEETMRRLRDMTMRIYTEASAYALERGVIIADTKFEFGRPVESAGDPGSPLLLIDEALTPDSSRFWPADEWRPGEEQPSFDKQYVREHLLQLVEQGAWNKRAPGPELPADVVRNTLGRYQEASRRLFG
ncbi:MAG: phosphoribosylaminoimidazolesuccinocarboxamide synthase [Phycisphaeraceae bacterium]|nr:MAG: phosphoribosylaminoimidazolesuccinocarboxamide synthase [Phycisphaeraceae bacterium]